ncbi:hypothetical protein [Capillibacterium thermochitinicola]|uniref:hypothetical protein n=1 Tax=Capillibacterium thermochitinicola TaxID=2699427 RepID=UPI001E540EB6|nr:hypothetical protein [Capillibacterium thermochitinicola]
MKNRGKSTFLILGAAQKDLGQEVPGFSFVFRPAASLLPLVSVFALAKVLLVSI